MAKLPAIASFKGLNNTADPMRLGLGWLATADNIDITDTGAIVQREGYTRAFQGNFTALYATEDHARAYVVEDGALKAMASEATLVPLQAGFDTATMHWTEINDQVFFNNGRQSGIITADHAVLPWAWTLPDMPQLGAVTGNLPAGTYQVRCTYLLDDGRETGASDAAQIALTDGQALQITAIPQQAGATTLIYIAPANSTVFQYAGTAPTGVLVWNAAPDALGRDLMTAFLSPLPAGCEVIQTWKGRIYASQYFPEADQSAIWISQPLGFHLFDLAKDFILVPGHVLMLAPHDSALVIGTDTGIHAYSPEGMAQLARYGVIAGQHWSHEHEAGRILFWSTRGLCAGLPFVNLTEKNVSVDPGIHAGGVIVRKNGQRRYLIALQQGGNAFNRRNQP